MFDQSFCAGLSCAKRETCARYINNYPETVQQLICNRPRTSWIMEPDPTDVCNAFIHLFTKGTI